MRFGILKKFLFGFLLVSLLPMLALSFFARGKLNELGESALESSRRALIENAASLLEARARAIAAQVATLLQDSGGDLRSLSTLPRDADLYLKFSRAHQRRIWIRTGTPGVPVEQRRFIPLYREVTFADADGIERIRIRDDVNLDTYRAVASPFVGPFGPEDYFNAARHLPRGDLHVSRLLGWHIRREEQLAGAPDITTAVGGKHFDGVIRFSTAVYDDSGFAGVVSLALDHRHLMEYTQHVLPMGSKEVVFPSYTSGNYAFLFDDEGWILTHPKFWDIRGFDRETGALVDPTSAAYNEAALKAGRIPFNLFHVPFIHANYRLIAEQATAGHSGVVQTANVGGISRVLAYAPIPFFHDEYRKTGFFGGVTLGARTDAFHRAVDKTSFTIEAAQHHTMEQFALIILVAGLVVAVLSVVLARSFTRPIALLADKVQAITRGKFDVSVDIRSGDELELLGRNFQEMGDQLQRNQQNLVKSMLELKENKNETESTNRRLEEQVNILKNLQSMGQFMSLTFDRDEVLGSLLKTCVEGIGFERALIYLYNPANRRLECVKTFGFDRRQKKLAFGAAYDVDRHDCIHTRVFSSGHAVLAADVARDPEMTPLDRRIATESDTNSFVVAPVRTLDRSIGVLGADCAESRRPIGEEEMEFLKILANEAAMAIERAQLMGEMVRERNFVENILSCLISGVIVVDFKGMVCSVNPKAEEILGRTREQLADRPVGLALQAYPRLLDLIRNTMADPRDITEELEFTGPDGKRIFMETAISSMGQQGEDSGMILAILRDVTQTKMVERHLNRSDRLVSLGTLAAGIAHEIRNPLTGISLLLDDLHDRMANRTDERLMMQSALEEIEKLEKIITELLAFASKPTSRPAPRDLNRVIDNSLFFIHKQCRAQGVELTRDKGNPLPPVDLDPEKIKQALLNVLLNSLAALPHGGQINITAGLRDDLDFFPGSRGIELTIADNGPGIQPDDINFIFDPFFTRSPEGSGLGLSITHTIIEEHGGKILVESEPGQGACFRILFPLSDRDRGHPEG
jgi:PAS domain S-box-containing protein